MPRTRLPAPSAMRTDAFWGYSRRNTFACAREGWCDRPPDRQARRQAAAAGAAGCGRRGLRARRADEHLLQPAGERRDDHALHAPGGARGCAHALRLRDARGARGLPPAHPHLRRRRAHRARRALRAVGRRPRAIGRAAGGRAPHQDSRHRQEDRRAPAARAARQARRRPPAGGRRKSERCAQRLARARLQREGGPRRGEGSGPRRGGRRGHPRRAQGPRQVLTDRPIRPVGRVAKMQQTRAKAMKTGRFVRICTPGSGRWLRLLIARKERDFDQQSTGKRRDQMNKKWIAAMLGSAAMAVSAGAVAQQADTGWYVGASIGQSDRDIDKDTAWKFSLGYQLNRNLSVELGYTNLGEVSAGGVDVEATGWEVIGLYKFPVANQFSIYGLAGIAMVEAEARFLGGTVSDDSTELTFGVGAHYDFSRTMGRRVRAQR